MCVCVCVCVRACVLARMRVCAFEALNLLVLWTLPQQIFNSRTNDISIERDGNNYEDG
jgi:hypothetical protein